MDKIKEHLELNRLVNEFLANGGKIQIIKEGRRGKCLPRKDDAPIRLNPTKQIPTGNRCKICDWSSTDSRSVCNPEIAEYPGNQLVIDDLTGDMLCRVCLSQVARMNRGFKIEADPGHGQSRYLLNNEAKELLESTGHFDEYRGKRQVYDPVLGHISEGSKRKGWSGHQDS